MQVDKLKTYIGFAIKSNKIIFGYDKLFESKYIPKIVLISDALNDKMRQKIHIFCENNNIKYIDIYNLNELVNRENCKCIGICDSNLSKVIESELEMLNG